MPRALRAYDKFKQKFLKDNCTQCRLAQGRTSLVFDRGNPASQILIVGEAPGAEEDKTGKCFVGRAGKVLDKCLDAIGLSTDRDTLIVNVVKCRPPDNRPPRADEAEACQPYLAEQIRLFSPKVVLLLGRTALKHLNPSMSVVSMKEAVGKIFDLDLLGGKFRAPAMLLYHPAYLLYDPRKRADMQSHLMVLKEYLMQTSKSSRCS